jgi:hypothetical protein
MKKFVLPREESMGPGEVCSSCNHMLEEHDFHQCKGLDPSHPQGICGCELFDDREYVARCAMLHVLKEMKAACQPSYDVRDLDDVRPVFDMAIWDLEHLDVVRDSTNRKLKRNTNRRKNRP